MRDWLIESFAVFGIQGQNWMLVTLVIVVIAVAISWRSMR
jgi:hypothetical protein